VIDPTRYATADAPQLILSKNEIGRLANRIEQDFYNAQSDHDQRIQRFRRYYRRWRQLTEQAAMSEEDEPNYTVPITQWQTSSKLAKEMSNLFGADAEIIAKPTGPNDQRIVRKISRFMTWRVFNSMKIVNPATVFNFRKILFGKSHAYRPWHRDAYRAPLRDGTEKEVVCYNGPGFFPLWPDDFIVPAEDAETVHDFSFCIRRYRATPDDLLRGEDSGIYQGIDENWSTLINQVSDARSRSFDGDEIKRDKDIAEGVQYEGSLSSAGSLQVHEWYGRWRRLKGRRDAREDNIEYRDRYESELVVKYVPELNLIVGVQDLAQMYPRTKRRRPFAEGTLMKDGSYWGPGFGEVLENIEVELSKNHNLATKAGEFSVGPLIIYRPGSGFAPEDFDYQPGRAIASEDPAGVRVVEFKANLEYPVAKEQAMISYSERLTGITDQNIGRTQSTPNAPRTARQTLALLEEGDVRASLDLSVLREDWGEILSDFWAMEQMYGSERTFFRVAEEDSGGLFDVAKGGAFLDAAEREETYDFDLKFATNAWSKETHKQNQLSLYQLDLQNPLVINNPKALWLTLDRIHRAFGDDRFADVIPEPADIGLPVSPTEEWTRMLQGEHVDVNPMDNDQLHLLDHNKRLAEAADDPQHDEKAYRAMVVHVVEHGKQMRQKQLMAELTSRLVQQLGGQGGQGGLQDGAAPMPLQNLHQQVGQMIGAEGSEQPGGEGAPQPQPAV